MILNHSKIFRSLGLNTICLLSCLFACAQVARSATLSDSMHVVMADMDMLKQHLDTQDPATQTSWAQLSNEQRIVLAPLGAEWDQLRPWQKEKMLDIVHDYHKMDAQQQLRLQRRLIKWSRMTPFERENARKRYQQFQSLTATQKEALKQKWKLHQQKTHSYEFDDPEFDISVP